MPAGAAASGRATAGTTRAVPDCSTNHSSADRIVVNSYNILIHFVFLARRPTSAGMIGVDDLTSNRCQTTSNHRADLIDCNYRETWMYFTTWVLPCSRQRNHVRDRSGGQKLWFLCYRQSRILATIMHWTTSQYTAGFSRYGVSIMKIKSL